MVYLSLSSRILLDVEALNMTESVGNFVKHRRAPIVVPTKNGFLLKYVPVISGETLAHAYQEILAQIAVNTGLPVCKLCRQGIFLKHTDRNVFERSGVPAPPKNAREFDIEKAIVENCVVEDVGGFLYTEAALKRTSRFSVGYMIPALDAIRATATEAQFHVRYDPLKKEAQMIYNVEIGSAIYSLNASLDVDGIGVSSIELGDDGKPAPIVGGSERKKRIEAAVKALELMVTQQLFGAKKTRFQPHWKILSLAAMISHPLPMNIQPGHSRSYIGETIAVVDDAIETLRAGDSSIDEKVFLYYYTEEDIGEIKPRHVVVEKAGNPAKAFSYTLDKILELAGV